MVPRPPLCREPAAPGLGHARHERRRRRPDAPRGALPGAPLRVAGVVPLLGHPLQVGRWPSGNTHGVTESPELRMQMIGVGLSNSTREVRLSRSDVTGVLPHFQCVTCPATITRSAFSPASHRFCSQVILPYHALHRAASPCGWHWDPLRNWPVTADPAPITPVLDAHPSVAPQESAVSGDI